MKQVRGALASETRTERACTQFVAVKTALSIRSKLERYERLPLYKGFRTKLGYRSFLKGNAEIFSSYQRALPTRSRQRHLGMTHVNSLLEKPSIEEVKLGLLPIDIHVKHQTGNFPA